MGALAGEGKSLLSCSNGSRKESPSRHCPSLVDDSGTELQGRKGQVRSFAGADQLPPRADWKESKKQHGQSLTRSWKETCVENYQAAPLCAQAGLHV